MLRRIALSLVILSIAAFAADTKNPNANGGGDRGARPRLPETSEQLEKLLNMNPADREKYLESVPEKRRENLQKRLDEIDKMPPARKTRVLSRLEMLNRLPPETQQQVRRAMQELQQLPKDRKMLVSLELQYMAPMSDEERRTHLNSEEFRNRYSADEKQMINSLIQVTPPPALN